MDMKRLVLVCLCCRGPWCFLKSDVTKSPAGGAEMVQVKGHIWSRSWDGGRLAGNQDKGRKPEDVATQQYGLTMNKTQTSDTAVPLLSLLLCFALYIKKWKIKLFNSVKTNIIKEWRPKFYRLIERQRKLVYEGKHLTGCFYLKCGVKIKKAEKLPQMKDSAALPAYWRLCVRHYGFDMLGFR